MLNTTEDHPCSFCGWIDGEHADGCPYEDYDYPQDIKPRQNKSTLIICPECGSDDISYVVVNNEHRHKCQNCYRTWSPDQTNPKYPEIEVQLTGDDGNAIAILSRVAGAMRKAGVSDKEITQFNEEAMSGDYDNLLQTCMKWVTVA